MTPALNTELLLLKSHLNPYLHVMLFRTISWKLPTGSLCAATKPFLIVNVQSVKIGTKRQLDHRSGGL